MIKTRMQSVCENLPRSNYLVIVDYMKPSIRAKRNHFILHVGKNDLNSNRPLDEIAKK